MFLYKLFEAGFDPKPDNILNNRELATNRQQKVSTETINKTPVAKLCFVASGNSLILQGIAKVQIAGQDG